MQICHPKENGYADILCESMQKYAQRQWSKGGVKSIIRHDMFNIETSESLGTKITIHYPSKRIVAKFCPFCGGSLYGFKNE